MQSSLPENRPGKTVIEELVRSLDTAAKFNPNDIAYPHAILWTDHDAQRHPFISQLRRLLPQLHPLCRDCPPTVLPIEL